MEDLIQDDQDGEFDEISESMDDNATSMKKADENSLRRIIRGGGAKRHVKF